MHGGAGGRAGCRPCWLRGGWHRRWRAAASRHACVRAACCLQVFAVEKRRADEREARLQEIAELKALWARMAEEQAAMDAADVERMRRLAAELQEFNNLKRAEMSEKDRVERWVRGQPRGWGGGRSQHSTCARPSHVCCPSGRTSCCVVRHAGGCCRAALIVRHLRARARRELDLRILQEALTKEAAEEEAEAAARQKRAEDIRLYRLQLALMMEKDAEDTGERDAMIEVGQEGRRACPPRVPSMWARAPPSPHTSASVWLAALPLSLPISWVNTTTAPSRPAGRGQGAAGQAGRGVGGARARAAEAHG